MAELADGEVREVKGSAAAPYQVRNVGGLYSCSCPAWRNQSVPIERRTCKHIKGLRGAEAEAARIGAPAAPAAARPAAPAVAGGVEPGPTEGVVRAPPLLLAHTWTPDQDPAGWWMSEKLDGVRAWWDGQAFVSRLGNRYFAPAWFTAGLPDMVLDGELWVGRKQFQRAVSIVRRQDASDLWREVRFAVFDAPRVELPFEQRLDAVRETLRGPTLPYAAAHDHRRCEGLSHLEAELDRLSAEGAEGLMLRRPGSRYEAGRSFTLLKAKRFFDAEARVIGHQGGAGKHEGRLGALLVELSDGRRFAIGTGLSDAERNAPPPVGAVVSFRYQELSDGGVPRFPSFLGLRAEVGGDAPMRGPAPAAPVPAPVPATVPAAATRTAAPLEWRCLARAATGERWAVSMSGARQIIRQGQHDQPEQTESRDFPNAAMCVTDTLAQVAHRLRQGFRDT
jgi:DNA ligase-1